MDEHDLLKVFADEHIVEPGEYHWKLDHYEQDDEVYLIISYTKRKLRYTINPYVIRLPDKVAKAAVNRYGNRQLVGVSFGD